MGVVTSPAPWVRTPPGCSEQALAGAGALTDVEEGLDRAFRSFLRFSRGDATRSLTVERVLILVRVWPVHFVLVGMNANTDGFPRKTEAWALRNQGDPYPNNEMKKQLANDSGLTTKQVTDWLGNWRKRKWTRQFNTELPLEEVKMDTSD